MIFGNLLNNYFYGKAGQGDFTIEKLPQNRRQLFRDIYKVHWSSLFGINLLYMIIWIPAIVWTFINFIMLMNLNDAAGMTATNLLSTYLLVLFPCIAITGPCNAGVSFVLRNWARDEHSFVLSDFWDALKGNWKQALLVSTVSGALPLITYVAITFYGGLMNQSIVFCVPLALVVMIAIVWKLAEMPMFVMMVTYDLKFTSLVRNSVLLTIGRLPYAVLIKLITFLVPIVGIALALLIPSIEMYVLLILGLLYIAYLVAFNKLIISSYANWLCETYMNTRIDGARTNIGLRPENWDDVEYIPQDDEE